MPAVRVRKGRVALTLASISVLLLILISSGHVWNTSADERFTELKAYGNSLRNAGSRWTSKETDISSSRSDYPQEQLTGSGTDRGPDGYADTVEEDEQDFSARYPNGELEPATQPSGDKLTDSHAVGLPDHHVGLPTRKGSAEAGAAHAPDHETGNLVDDASVIAPTQNQDNAEQTSTTFTSTTSTSTTTSTTSKIHWTQFPEHYPVPTESLIALPTGTPKKIPKIQHTFGAESAKEKLDRENKLTVIKAAFNRTWTAYREDAWTHDELAPVQAASENSRYAFRDPFGGWGATLVDSLDTLWLMGMTAEFDEAVNATMNIDFTTVAREDIPIFETTIRYVGGLIGAYDLSGRKELIIKCVELADIIMAAFDTPNRMPNLYYHWKPQFASVPRRASTSVCLAEMGSLSLEFTRLAQITGDQKYYDAIARISNNMEEFQNRTSVPGLWPLSFDASGCANPWTQQEMQKNGLVDPRKDESSFGADSDTNMKSTLPSAVGPDARKDQSSFGDDSDSSGSTIERRQVRKEGATTVTAADSVGADGESTDRATFVAQVEEKMAAMPTKKYKSVSSCLPFEGFQSVHRDEYALGGRADSTYEYLPKEWLLLGGLNDQYKSMYEHALAASKEYLLLRPMINDTVNVTFSGTFDVKLGGTVDENGKPEGYLSPKTGHLNCFVGGMVGLGARAFGHEEDMELAIELAESCAWAYRITASGVMPEEFTLLPCPDSGSCEWNETYWKHQLDPAWASREGMIAKWEIDESERAMKQEEADKLAAAAKLQAEESEHDEKQDEAKKLAVAAGLEDEYSDNEDQTSDAASTTTTSAITRRHPPGPRPDTARVLGATHGQHPNSDADGTSPTKLTSTAPAPNFKLTFPKPLTHEEFVQGKITREKLYPGVTSMNDKRYLLRPEAIESIFYLHRLTGNPIWRRHGWDMFLAVEHLSRTEVAYSSVLDVMAPETPYHQGVMESFWTAETLKYFWLLFEEESVMDLGSWVLNTEAHGFRLPR